MTKIFSHKIITRPSNNRATTIKTSQQNSHYKFKTHKTMLHGHPPPHHHHHGPSVAPLVAPIVGVAMGTVGAIGAVLHHHPPPHHHHHVAGPIVGPLVASLIYPPSPGFHGPHHGHGFGPVGFGGPHHGMGHHVGAHHHHGGFGGHAGMHHH